VSVFERVFGPRYPVLQRGIVALKDGTSIRGVIWARRGEYLVLRNAEMLRSKGETVAIDGEVAIPAGNVQFLQIVGAG
jgi:hypothetical protein